MATATHCYDQVVALGERHRCHNVGNSGAADDQRGAPVDHAIMNGADAVVLSIAGTEQGAAHLSLELLNSGRREPGRRAAGRGAVLVSHRVPPSGSCVATGWAACLMAVFLGRVPLACLARASVLPPGSTVCPGTVMI